MIFPEMCYNQNINAEIIRKGSVTMPPAFAQEKCYTIDDIYALPDGERAELIDGQIYSMSPPSRKHQLMDYYTKLFKYHTSGVRAYWIVDPEKNRILVYDFESEDTGDYTFADSVKAGIYDDLYANFADIAKALNT